MRVVLIILIVLHGLLHFMGFANAYAIGNMAEFAKELPKPIGLLWLFTGLLFIASAVMILIKRKGWAIWGILAVIVSQLLILTVWSDAKYGTLANIVILIAAIITLGTERFQNSFKNDVLAALESASKFDDLVTERDLEPLPPLVQEYLRYVGVVGKPKVFNIRIIFEGRMREKGKDWFNFTSTQYNSINPSTRFFFMKAKVKGLPTYGYHRYKNGEASMQIKLLSLLPVVDIDKPELFKTETVTFFNDLCLFAPGALIDKRISWKILDNLSVKATLTTNNTRISAILYFNEKGQLVNFISEDRMAIGEMKTFPFSTPAGNFQNINGFNLPTYGEGTWHYPDGEFVYGKFNVKHIEYNITKFK